VSAGGDGPTATPRVKVGTRVAAGRNAWPNGAILVVVDVQEAFVGATAWHVPGLGERVAAIADLAAIAGVERTLLTRFRPARRLVGSWRPYYRAFPTMRDPESAHWRIVDGLAQAGAVVEKSTYSAFAAAAFVSAVHRLRPRALAVCGAETDVCVLATVQDAIDRGLAVCVLEDLCVSADPAGHRAALTIWRRLPQQVRVLSAAEFLAGGDASWPS
jgi:nicotinamidase-related amidase